MKYALILALWGCGYESVNNEMIGQVKKVKDNTPLICAPFTTVDVSLGVMRNGVGSMSVQDVWLYVEKPADLEIMRKANESGEIVKISYDEARFRWCVDEKVVRSVEIVPE